MGKYKKIKGHCKFDFGQKPLAYLQMDVWIYLARRIFFLAVGVDRNSLTRSPTTEMVSVSLAGQHFWEMAKIQSRIFH